MEFTPIAHIESPYMEKFGVPRQSGRVAIPSKVVFESAFRSPEALRGLSDFSHIWLIWVFSEVHRESWSPTVRPPRLGGNTRLGVFATRSPFRPNPIGLSCVKLLGIQEEGEKGQVLVVEGADLMNGTPILDIKPYLPYADIRQEATGGFTDSLSEGLLTVSFVPEVEEKLGEELSREVRLVLAQDPRPRYQDDAERIYGMAFGGYNLRFRVQEGMLTVLEAKKL